MIRVNVDMSLDYLDYSDVNLDYDDLTEMIKTSISESESEDEIASNITEYVKYNYDISGTKNGDVDISVDDIMDAASSEDILEIIDWLVDAEYINETNLITSHDSSYLEMEWLSLISKLSELRLRISNEDEETIKKIINKY